MKTADLTSIWASQNDACRLHFHKPPPRLSPMLENPVTNFWLREQSGYPLSECKSDSSMASTGDLAEMTNCLLAATGASSIRGPVIVTGKSVEVDKLSP
jgi:hypothetical protein